MISYEILQPPPPYTNALFRQIFQIVSHAPVVNQFGHKDTTKYLVPLEEISQRPHPKYRQINICIKCQTQSQPKNNGMELNPKA